MRVLDRTGSAVPDLIRSCLRRIRGDAQKATLIYRRTGNLRSVRHLLGHTKIESNYPAALIMLFGRVLIPTSSIQNSFNAVEFMCNAGPNDLAGWS